MEKVQLRNKAAQKKAAPSLPSHVVAATHEKDEVKVAEEEPKVEGLCFCMRVGPLYIAAILHR